jgi:hypothetical protein
MYIDRLTLLCSLSLLPLVRSSATNKNANGSCSLSHNQLQAGTYQLTTDCADTMYCDPSGVCKPKGCRRDEFPLGYSQDAQLPPRCKDGEFCPDEQDKCQNLLPVGSTCQLNRDGASFRFYEAIRLINDNRPMCAASKRKGIGRPEQPQWERVYQLPVHVRTTPQD